MNKEEIGKLEALKNKVPIFAKRIAPIYKLLKWEWGHAIPSKSQIISHIQTLADELIKTEKDFLSCGGIIIKYNERFEEWELLFQDSFIEE